MSLTVKKWSLLIYQCTRFALKKLISSFVWQISSVDEASSNTDLSSPFHRTFLAVRMNPPLNHNLSSDICTSSHPFVNSTNARAVSTRNNDPPFQILHFRNRQLMHYYHWIIFMRIYADVIIYWT